MKVVLANGVFDILHYGHLLHLRAARRFGDFLVVSVTEDAHVNKGPGRPINPLSYRMEILRALRCVDSVISTTGSLEAIRQVKPDIFVKGIDYANGHPDMKAVAAVCAEVGSELRFTDTRKMSATVDIIGKMVTS